MKKISVQGGAPVVLCDAIDARGASWGTDDSIVAALNVYGALSRVAAEGGTPKPAGKLRSDAMVADLGTGEAAYTHRWPQFLPGGDGVLFTLSSSNVAFENASIAAVSLRTGKVKILVRGAYSGRYLATGNSEGHLVYVHEGVLFAVPFNPAQLELRGAAVPLVEGLAADPSSGAGQFSFSGTPSGSGSLVYRAGHESAQSYPVLWLDNSGKTEPLMTMPGFYHDPRFSPNGQQLALMMQGAGSDRHVFVYDWKRDTTSRFALDVQQPTYPVWSPDGKHIVFRFSAAGGFGLGWIRSDGSGDTHNLLENKNRLMPYSFFPDGRRLAYAEFDPDSGFHIWTLAFDVSDPDHPKPGKPELFLRTLAEESNPAVSPDGRWIAYQSDESGRLEVYVRPFPGPGGKWQISNAGGGLPVWSRANRELFFETLENRIMVTEYASQNDVFIPGRPRLQSDQQLQDVSGLPNYDVAPDGKRFAIFPKLKPATEENGTVHMAFLLNFFDELRRRVPTGNPSQRPKQQD